MALSLSNVFPALVLDSSEFGLVPCGIAVAPAPVCGRVRASGDGRQQQLLGLSPRNSARCESSFPPQARTVTSCTATRTTTTTTPTDPPPWRRTRAQSSPTTTSSRRSSESKRPALTSSSCPRLVPWRNAAQCQTKSVKTGGGAAALARGKREEAGRNTY